MTRAVWLNDDGTEPELTPATVIHPAARIAMFAPLAPGETFADRGAQLMADYAAKYGHRDHVHRSFTRGDIDALRAEVVALREECGAAADHYEDGDYDDYAEMRYHTGQRHACELVLDLIDKHAREGQ